MIVVCIRTNEFNLWYKIYAFIVTVLSSYPLIIRHAEFVIHMNPRSNRSGGLSELSLLYHQTLYTTYQESKIYSFRSNSNEYEQPQHTHKKAIEVSCGAQGTTIPPNQSLITLIYSLFLLITRLVLFGSAIVVLLPSFVVADALLEGKLGLFTRRQILPRRRKRSQNLHRGGNANDDS